MSLKPRPEIRAKIVRIADVNGMSMTSVMELALAAGLPMVEQKLGELHQPAVEKKAA